MASIFDNINKTSGNLFPKTNITTPTNISYTQSKTNPYASTPVSNYSSPYTSSVISSNIAKTNITDNTNKLNNLNTNLNQPYSTNPAYNVMANLADNTLAETGGTGVTDKASALSGLILELAGRANSQKESGDYQGMNETLKQYEEARKARETELTNIYSKLPELRSAYEATLTKSAAEQQLESQLADIQGQITQYGIDTNKAITGLEGQGRAIPAELIRGQQEKLYTQRKLGEQTLQGQEANLLTRLGLEQESRKLSQEAGEFQINSLFDDAEITQKAIDAIDSQTNAFMDKVDNLSDNARNTLSTIIDKFAGMDMNDLPEESQLALANLAENSGIDLQTLILGMKANKDAIEFDQAYKLNQLALDQYKASTTGTFTPEEIIKYEQSLRKELNALPQIKDYTSIKNSYTQVKSAYDQALQSGKDKTTKAAADQLLITAFNKMIDPTSVVREGEYARTTSGQALINQLAGKANAALYGGTGLVDTDRKAILDMVEKLYGDYVNMRNATVNDYRSYASEVGGDPNKIGVLENPTTNTSQMTDDEAYQEYLKIIGE